MKDKKMLSEAQVKRFMKLAGNHVLSETFVDGLSEEEEQLDELEVEKEGLYKDDEELGPVPGEAPEDLAPEEELPDMAPEGEGEEVMDAGPMSKVRDIVADAVMDALSGAVETGELDISEEDPVGDPTEGDPEGELGAPVEEPMDEPPLEEASESDDLEEADVHYFDEEGIANEVLKRVAARLVKESKKEKLIDQLAQSLEKRLK